MLCLTVITDIQGEERGEEVEENTPSSHPPEKYKVMPYTIHPPPLIWLGSVGLCDRKTKKLHIKKSMNAVCVVSPKSISSTISIVYNKAFGLKGAESQKKMLLCA